MEFFDEIYEQVIDFLEQGNVFMDVNDYVGVIWCWLQVLEVLLVFVKDWEVYIWFCVLFGDVSFFFGDVVVVLEYFMDVLNGLDGYVNFFILYCVG